MPLSAARPCGVAEPFAAALDEEMSCLIDRYHVPGLVVATIENGAVTWTKAYGSVDYAGRRPLKPDRVFNFASAAKTMTAWAVMHLVEDGKVDLDAPADRYLRRWHIPPCSDFDASGVIIRRLLSHTAGLTVPGYGGYPSRRPLPTLKKTLEGGSYASGAVRVGWRPGSRFHYSMPNTQPAA